MTSTTLKRTSSLPLLLTCLILKSLSVTQVAAAQLADDQLCQPSVPEPITGVIVEVGYGISPYAATQHALEKLAVSYRADITVQNITTEHSSQTGIEDNATSESRITSQVDIDAQEVSSGYLCGQYFTVQSADMRSDVERVMEALLKQQVVVSGAPWLMTGKLVQQLKSNDRRAVNAMQELPQVNSYLRSKQGTFEFVIGNTLVALRENNLFELVNFNPLSASSLRNRKYAQQPGISMMKEGNLTRVTGRLLFPKPAHLAFVLPKRTDYSHYSVFNVSENGLTRWLGTKAAQDNTGKLNQWLPNDERVFQDAYVFIWHNESFKQRVLKHLDPKASVNNTNALLGQLSQLPVSQWVSLETQLGVKNATNL